jgi:mxaK protein
MKRSHGHTLFALAAAACAIATVAEMAQLQHARRINAEIHQWTTPAVDSRESSLPAPTLTAAPGSAPSASSISSAGYTDRLSPEGRLSRAVALSKSDYDAALAAFKAIIQSNRADLRRMALYDLGNLHLHQAIQAGVGDSTQSLPLTELAKQSYRDLLRQDPYDWDARYNLERALRLAPEDEDDADQDTGPPDPRQHERTTIADPRMDLP